MAQSNVYRLAFLFLQGTKVLALNKNSRFDFALDNTSLEMQASIIHNRRLAEERN